MVEEFIRQGHLVAGCARSADAVAALRTRFGAPHEFQVVDVTDDAQVRGWATGLAEPLQSPDLLVNNAAVINRNARLWEVNAEEFSRVIDVNIKGVANVIRNFLPAMVRRRTGVVANFSSGWGRSTDAEVAPYCATKWAIEGLTQALALELPSGMVAAAVNPGIIDTDMLRSCFGGDAGAYPKPAVWARKAVPFLLGLGPKDNGRPATVA